MEIILFSMLMAFALLGLVFVGMLNRYKMLERRLNEAIRQFNVIAISQGRRN